MILQAAGGGDMTSTLILFALMFVVMFFFMIRPQMQKQKKEKKFQEDLKKGDKIVTTSGIHGKIAEISADIVTIETAAGKIRFEKTAISNELTKQRYQKADAKK